MRMGNAQINTNPCTQAEQNANWATTSQLLNLVIEVVSAGTSGDTFKVATDAPNIATPNYLNDQMYYPASGGNLGDHPSASAPVVADVASAKERLRVDFTQLPGFAGIADGGRYFLEAVFYAPLDGGAIAQWALANDVTDNYTILVTADDSTPSVLHDAFNLNATYVDGADILVATETVGAAASNQKERPFLDVSIMAGFHLTEFRVWTTSNNVTTLLSAADFGTAFFGGITIDGGSYSGGVLTIDGGGGGSGTAKFGKADANILPRAGTVAKSGTVSIWTMDGGGNLTDTGDNETWWNISSTGLVRAGDFIQAKLDATSGKMLIDFEDCTMSDL